MVPDRAKQPPGELRVDRAGGLAVDADHLVWMTVLGSPQQPLLDGGRASGLREHALRRYAELPEQFYYLASFRVVSDDGGQCDVDLEGRQHGGHASGPAQPVFLPVDPQHWDRRFGADPVHLAPYVAVEHHVADHQDPGPSGLGEQLDQVAGHAGTPPGGVKFGTSRQLGSGL